MSFENKLNAMKDIKCHFYDYMSLSKSFRILEKDETQTDFKSKEQLEVFYFNFLILQVQIKVHPGRRVETFIANLSNEDILLEVSVVGFF